MHIQRPTDGWLEALVAMPDGAYVKSVSDAGVLTAAHNAWTAAGRDPARLLTGYRHYDLYLPKGDWESLKAQWRAMFFRFVDRTYLEQHAAHVGAVEELNEYFTNDSIYNTGELPLYLNSARAAVAVWNGEFRGRVVHSPDGGEGTIRADCRLILGNGFVTHDIPREMVQLAVDEDCIVGYHAYTKWSSGQRWPDDWPNHSGHFDTLEQRYGLRPAWAFTECGPYLGTHEGWRHPGCLGGDATKLVDAMRLWLRDVAATAAYRENRIYGTGAWFTVGAGVDWDWYELRGPELLALAQMAAQEWAPGQEIAVTPEDLQKIKAEALSIVATCDKYLNPPLFRVRVLAGTLNVRAGPGVTFAPVGTVSAGQELGVYEVAASGWYRISADEQRWISGSPTYTTRI
jgi:hypothetical protein